LKTQQGKQKPYIEGQTIQWQTEKEKKKLITYKLTNIIAIEAIYLSKIIKTSKYKHI
jgi:hypothetical protein